MERASSGNDEESRYGWDSAVSNPNRAKVEEKQAKGKAGKAGKKEKKEPKPSLMKKMSSKKDDSDDDDEYDEEEYNLSPTSAEDEKHKGEVYLAELEKSGYDQKMGLVMERADALRRAQEGPDMGNTSPHLGPDGGRQSFGEGEDQTPYVKVVVGNTPAERAGITLGSTLMAIDGVSIKDKPYNDCIADIRQKWSTGTGISLKFARGNVAGTEGFQGEVMARVSGGAFSVGSFRPGQSLYKNKFYAFGGPNTDYLQLFETKEQYHRCLIQAYENRMSAGSKMMTFHITKEHRCGRIKHKSYRMQGPLYYFKLKVRIVLLHCTTSS
jgi:hypothetical protein